MVRLEYGASARGRCGRRCKSPDQNSTEHLVFNSLTAYEDAVKEGLVLKDCDIASIRAFFKDLPEDRGPFQGKLRGHFNRSMPPMAYFRRRDVSEICDRRFSTTLDELEKLHKENSTQPKDT